MKILLLEEEHPEWGGSEIAKEVPCSPNFVYKTISDKNPIHVQMMKALDAEERKKLLSEPVPKTKRGKKGTKALKGTPGSSKLAGSSEADFRRALRLVGIERARQLLDAFEREE